MAKGPLGTRDKYAIQGMLSDGKTVAEIEVALGREGGKAVKNYIAGDLDKLMTTVANVKVARAEAGDKTAFDDVDEAAPEAAPEVTISQETGNKEVSAKQLIEDKLMQDKKDIVVDEGVVEKTAQLLRGLAMKDGDARDLIARCTKRLLRQPQDATEFLSLCISTLNAADKMIGETSGGAKGVKIMTAAASAAMDISGQKYRGKVVSRSARGNTFNPKTGEIL